MSELTKVYFPQPENMADPTTKIVFHNGIRNNILNPEGPEIPFTNTSNFSLSRETGLPKPSNDVKREIVYPANMRFALVNTSATNINDNISKTTPTSNELRAVFDNNTIDGIYNNTIISNKMFLPPSSTLYPDFGDVEPTAINPRFFTNVSISIPNDPEVVDVFNYALSDGVNNVIKENI
jgi:hypothetical protein